MNKFKSQALHIIRIKSWKASGSVNPPSLIPALRKIAILGLKTSFSILFLHSNRCFHIFENITHLQKFNNYIKPKSHLATLDHAISYSNQDQQTTWEESKVVVLHRSVVFGILILMSVRTQWWNVVEYYYLVVFAIFCVSAVPSVRPFITSKDIKMVSR